MTSKKRNPNFTETEIQILLSEVEKKKDVLFSRLSNHTTNSAKKKAWESICNKINCVNIDHKRSVEEIRKKWTTYMSNTKRKVAQSRKEARKTGGGPPPDEITSLQQQVVGIIGNTPIDGIPGGVDTLTEPSVSNSEPEDESDMEPTSGSIIASIDASPRPSSSATSMASMISAKPTVAASLKEAKIDIVAVERQRLELDKENIQIQREMLTLKKDKIEILRERNRINNERLDIERQRLNLEKAKQQFKLAQFGFGVQLPQQQQQETTSPTIN